MSNDSKKPGLKITYIILGLFFILSLFMFPKSISRAQTVESIIWGLIFFIDGGALLIEFLKHRRK